MRMQCTTLVAGADLRDFVDLERISAGTLVVNGAEDPLVDAADLARISNCLPLAEVSLVPGVGHFLHLERPSVVDIYLEFLQRPVLAADVGIGGPPSLDDPALRLVEDRPEP
jgi:pimeloyl-ACP methyl ester carboxylesterase